MNSITIVTYNINNEKHPFVTFGLNLLEELDFPIIELDEIPYNEKDEYVISLTEDYLKNVLSNYRDVSMTYKDEVYDEETKSLTLYFEIFMDHRNSYILSPAAKIWFATIHEIINTNKFCEYNISPNVVNRIKSKIEDFSEMIVPRVCYDGGKMEKILFESLFGSSKRDDGYGYVFQFYEYLEAIRRAENDRPNSKSKKAGVLRYVVFEDQLTTDSYDMFLPLSVHRV